MKKVIFSLFAIVVCLSLFAQAPPQGINYQAMVYAPYGNQQVGVNSAGQIPANTKQVLVKFTLEEGNNGPVIYEETHTDTTDQYGLLNTVIGTGTPTSNSPGLFNQIDWSLGDPYLRVSITLTQYNSTVSSYQKLWSVPYALYADQSNTADYATSSGHADSSDYADMAGNGITGVIDNGDGTLTFTYYDGSSYTTGVLNGLGTVGPQGPAGQNGTNGQSAYDIWLAQGNSGTQQDFLNSLQGTNGTNGQSAYDIWLAQGNIGTEQDFLSAITGAQGPQGIQGPTGQNGTNGVNGINGQNGLSAYEVWLTQGNTGTEQAFLSAITGAQGPQGIQGPAGQNGTNGVNGINGQNGLSAYEVWLAQGNIGTEQDFLSAITGAQGSQGIQGPAGTNGVNGTNGQSAYDIWLSQGNSGTVQDFLNSLTGPQGPNGANGSNGSNGQNGLSAYQIWLSLGNTGTEQDFLNSLTGPQGPAGNSLSNGTVNNQMLYWNGTSWVNLDPGINGQVLTLCNGILTWTTGGTCPGSISTLNCTSATNSGTLSSGIVASGVSSSVPYTGGNGGSYSAQNINSTGVTGLTASLTAGTFNNGSGSLFYTISGTPNTSGTANFALTIGGQSCTLSRTVTLIGSITALDCSTATNTGTSTSGTAASGVSANVPYTGGNGGAYSAQSVTSSGVTGLTASISAGTFTTGSGNLSYTISGTPSAGGLANFALNVGGQSCTLSLTVTSNTASQYPAGSVFCASGPTAIVDVTNPTTGKTWMDRNLGATQVATSSTDAAAYGDLYQWGRRSDGHQCRNSATTSTLSSVDQPGHGNFILSPGSPYDWRSAQNINLWQGVNGINNPCPNGYRLPTETELNNELSIWVNNYDVAALNSPLRLPVAGYRLFDDASMYNIGIGGYYWSSNVSNSDSRILVFNSLHANMDFNYRASGCSIRCLKDESTTQGSINSIDCGTATNSGTLTSGTAASGVSSSVPYTGGNGGTHNGQTVASTGVTGLTATLASGTFAVGTGNLSYTISGTPNSSGTANFALNIGGQSCTLTFTVASNLASQYPTGSVFCASGPTAIVDVTNPTTGKTWMDRNLGASQVATSSTDANSYGDLYQWGRRADGHQCRNSATTSSLSSIDQPGHGDFILSSSANNADWRSPQNPNLWMGINGINNPCPFGYRLPSENEMNEERLSWTSQNSIGAFESPLKFPLAGYRSLSNGVLMVVGSIGYYWSSTASGNLSKMLYFNSSNPAWPSDRADGLSVRCIKDVSSIQGSINTLDCGTATISGTLTSGTAASGVSSNIPYTGGNGGTHNGQTVTSTGVTGLTATLSAGTFANGTGNVLYTITGTPTTTGTASFALNIGNSSCILNFSVDNTQNNNSTHSCGTQNIHNPSLSYGNLTDQDGNTYKTIVIGTQEWMAENLKVSKYRNGDIIPTVTNGNTWSGLNTGASCLYNNDQNNNCPNGKLYNWYVVADLRKICPQGWHIPSDNDWNTLISYLDPTNVPNADGIQSLSAGSKLKSLFSMDGTTPVPNSTNESGMSAQMNGFRYEDGNFYDMNSNLLWWSSTERDINSAWFRSLNYSGNFVDRRSYNKKNGFSARCLKDEPLDMINTLDCNNYVFTENLTQGILTQSANLLVSYSGGNGLSFDSQIWNSTGVLGLTATIAAGTFLNGSGNLSYTISGTPQNYGTATFNITIGGMSCSINLTVNPTSSIYPPNYVNCNNTTAIVDVTNPTTGKTWMDRNLGASQVATSSTDANSYGDLYQWGRFSDGHQCRNSPIEYMTSSLNIPSNNSFFVVSSYPNDWRWPQNNDLWQGVNGLNNPCPIGYRMPTNTEFVNEISSWSTSNSNGAFTSPLKLTMAGIRNSASGSIEENEFSGYYWSSSPATIGAGGGVTTYYNSSYLYFNSSDASTSAVKRADGMSIRCIKD